ncbi:hypothetical protein [Gimesia aquarii]|uniref:hypothetical protein n=1 Tax=Gimesia aquarii TaxID=2527964 RepID=UPI0011A590F3|nr:hypothetical protein [Gimesia aquarii]
MADSEGLIPISQVLSEPRVGLTVSLVVIASLWLNALELHHSLVRGAATGRNWVAERLTWFVRKRKAGRVRPGSEETLRDLLRTPCRERRWFLWFLEGKECTPLEFLLPYGTTHHDEEFAGARSLLQLGLLHRTGDSHSDLVFVHKRLYDVYKATIAGDPRLTQELDAEKDVIRAQGRSALREELPTYATERFFRAMQQKSSKQTT